jgi:hypothetical protein
MTTPTPRTDAVWKANTDIEGCITNIEPIYLQMAKMEDEIIYLRHQLFALQCKLGPETTPKYAHQLTMTTKETLLDLLLQQQETINLLRDTARYNYRVDTKAIELTDKWKDYWKKRAEKAENELIDIKLFGKKQPQPPT